MRDRKWDKRYMDLAREISGWSKDRGTKVGAVIVGSAGQIIATGYNGLPRGVNDDVDERYERMLKYKWTEHAERNAIYNAARTGTSTEGATLYVPWHPCTDCARGIIQAGIALVVGIANGDPRWTEDMEIAYVMLHEAGVQVRLIEDE